MSQKSEIDSKERKLSEIDRKVMLFFEEQLVEHKAEYKRNITLYCRFREHQHEGCINAISSWIKKLKKGELSFD